MTEHIKIAIRAAIEAGEAIMEVYNSPIEVEYKEDNSPLTLADSKSNDVINKHLLDTSIPIISEENKQVTYEERKHWNLCWMVDPLDGTKEFIKRNGEFTVNIALIENNVPIMGVIYVPVTKELYFGDVKEKVSKKLVVTTEDLSNLTTDSINLKLTENNSDTIRIVGSRSHMSAETLDFVEHIKDTLRKEVSIVSKGSSLKFCIVAEGKADIYPRFAPTMEWDTAAGQAICNAAGLKVTSHETKESLKYNKENLLNPWFLVAKA